MPPSAALEALGRGDASFLRRAGSDPESLAPALRLGAGAPYYLSFWSKQLGLPEQARALLQLQWERGRGWWREEASLELLALSAASGQWAEVEREGRRFLPHLRGSGARWKCERAVVEALYWQRKDRELLPLLERLDDGRDDELLLFRAAASCRLAAREWPDSFRALFFQRRLSALHDRAFSFLQLEDRLASFDAAESAFFGAKAALAQGRPADALAALEASLPRLPPERLLGSPLLAEAAAAFRQAAEPVRGMRLLAALPGGADAAEWAGRLARQAGDKDSAERFFRQVLASSASGAQRDRAAWQLLDMARERPGPLFREELLRQTGGWADPAYFSDLLDQEISGLVARRQWAELGELRRRLGGAAAEGVQARLAYLEGRLCSLGLWMCPGGPQELYREAARRDPGGYYGWLAAAMLPDPPAFLPAAGETLEEAAVLEPAVEPDPAPPSPPAAPESEAPAGTPAGTPAAADRVSPPPESFLLGFVEFGLYRTGYQRILAEQTGLDPRFLRQAARELDRRGQHLLALRLLSRALASSTADEATLRLFYPQPFREEVERVCRAEELPPALFYALVREESHFDPAIVSSAGAVGLTQLLPETARDMARLLRLEEPDLRNPEHNLRLGGRYLGRLLGRSESVAKALLGYNAGPGRLRQWERSFDGLPADLLVEAAPYPETRRYVRKVLVSALHYGWLYYGLPPAATVRLFYPEVQ